MNELIRVTQLPVIEEELLALKEAVDKRVKESLALVCTEDTLQAVKAERTQLRKDFDELESQRKAVKASVLGPYERFEGIYKECVSDAFKKADDALKQKIYATEHEIRRRCDEGLREYFAELCEVNHLDWLEYERAGIKVDMASAKAKTPTKLRKQLAEFVAHINDSVNLIADMDDAEEIMVEFRRSLDVGQAIGTVQDRHRRIEAERAAKEEREAARQADIAAIEKVVQVQKSYAPRPAEAPEPQEKDPHEVIPRCTFTTINATRAKLRRVKDFLNMEGIKYE